MNIDGIVPILMTAVAGFSSGVLSLTALNAASAVNECRMNYFPSWIERRALLSEFSVLVVTIIIAMACALPILVMDFLFFLLDLDFMKGKSETEVMLISLVGGIGVRVLVARVRLQRVDPIQEALNDRKGKFPILIEVVSRTGRDAPQQRFEEAIKNRDVRILRCGFRRIQIDRSHQPHVVKKYALETYEPPFIVFLGRDGNALVIDGRHAFSGEDIETPERYAKLLTVGHAATAL